MCVLVNVFYNLKMKKTKNSSKCPFHIFFHIKSSSNLSPLHLFEKNLEMFYLSIGNCLESIDRYLLLESITQYYLFLRSKKICTPPIGRNKWCQRKSRQKVFRQKCVYLTMQQLHLNILMVQSKISNFDAYSQNEILIDYLNI